jgi:hypothetical protein
LDLQLRIIHASDFLRARPTAQLDLEQSRQILLALAAANKPPADRDILLDLRSTSGSRLETMEIVELVRVMVENLTSFQHKLALLLSPDSPGYRAQLLEHLADNRGFNVEVFKDFEQAICWLMSSTPLAKAPQA